MEGRRCKDRIWGRKELQVAVAGREPDHGGEEKERKRQGKALMTAKTSRAGDHEFSPVAASNTEVSEVHAMAGVVPGGGSGASMEKESSSQGA